MNRKTMLSAGIALGALAWLARQSWPARLRGVALRKPAHNPRTARLILRYLPGARPESLILDLSSSGGGGSATVAGDQNAVDVLLHAPLGDDAQVRATATYRVGGRWYTAERTFTPADER